MAHEATTWAWSQNLPANQKIVLLALADIAGGDMTCFPGQKRLSSMTGMHVNTVARVLNELEEAGLIRREQRFRENGSRTSDRFHLLVPPHSYGGTPPTTEVGAPHHSGGGKNLPTEPIKKTTARTTRLPDDWEPSNAHRTLALSLGVDVDFEAEKFKDWTASDGVTKQDWEATFRNWLRNAKPRQRAGTPPPRPSRDDEIRAFLQAGEPKGITDGVQ